MTWWRNIRTSSWPLCCFSEHKLSVPVDCFKFRSEIKWRSSRDSVVSTVTRLRDGRFGARIPAWARYFSLFQSVQTISVAHQSFSSIGTGSLNLGRSGQAMYTTHVHLVPMLKTSGTYTSWFHGMNREYFTFFYLMIEKQMYLVWSSKNAGKYRLVTFVGTPTWRYTFLYSAVSLSSSLSPR